MTQTETLLSISPDAPAWDLDGGRVLGIAFTVSGPVLPGPSFGFGATPGGQDPAGLYGVIPDLTIYGACDGPAVTTSGQVIESKFADLRNVWCIPEYRQSWTANSVVTFWWGMVSVVVDSIDADSGVNSTPDPYDFCLSDIRPILAGAGPDEPADPVPDAGSSSASDAAAP